MFATRDGQTITVAKDLVACFRQRGNWAVELHCDRRWKFVVAADSMDLAHAMALAVYSKEFGKQSVTGADCQRIAA